MKNGIYCGICEFFCEIPKDNDPLRGECRLNPPPHIAVAADSQCGRFVASEKALENLWSISRHNNKK
jgi:hypothetical protein